ncbi:Hypothetical protein A7982_00898 [Minicystis rosea]|nr:Hypothetical protein A7982_00898 [Minicystis rosea]
MAATTKQTWLARYDFGPELADGRYDITVSAWSGSGTGTAIDLTTPPRFTTVLHDTTVDSMYAGQSADGPVFYVDRESIATSAEEALGVGRDLFMVAHQDDDLLFMNPDVSKSIRSGNVVRTIYLTDGEANRSSDPDDPNKDGDPAYRTARENGVMSAYAQMAGLPNTWSCGDLAVADKVVKLCTLNERVSLVFVRLPASAYTWTTDNQLISLWSVPGFTMTDTNHGYVYTRSDVITVLSQLMAGFAPTRLGSLDSTTLHGGDHPEHYYAALFAHEARQAYIGEHAFRLYRGYNIGDAAENLSTAEAAAKDTTFRWYSACDKYMCTTTQCGLAIGCEPTGYSSYYAREYSIPAFAPSSGPLSISGGMCLTSSSVTAAVTITSCSASAEQRWTLTADHHLTGADGRCLAIDPGGTSVALDDCAATPEQRWTVFEDGVILGEGAVCLETTGGSTTSGTPVDTTFGCTGSSSQRWTFTPSP